MVDFCKKENKAFSISGVAGYFRKPFDDQALLDAVKACEKAFIADYKLVAGALPKP